ncbi:MAG: hypothetical protein AABX29_03500 [Nanoarchaeota archaeon]
MGFFSWLFRRKKKEESSDYDEGEMPEQEMQQQVNPKLDYGAGYMQPIPIQNYDENKEFRILNDKLDIINSKLEVINQRLANLEQKRPREEIVQRW